MHWRAALLGMLLLTVPAVVAVLALGAPEAPPPRVWTKTPPRSPEPAPKPRWDGPATESLALLRETAVAETALAGPALQACERSVSKLADAGRNKAFRDCAFRALARADGFGSSNGRMLMNLADTAEDGCRQRVMGLGGMTASLGMAARTTLRGAMSLAWDELLAGSKTIRAVAREASKLARDPGWKTTCAALPERDRATGDEPVA